MRLFGGLGAMPATDAAFGGWCAITLHFFTPMSGEGAKERGVCKSQKHALPLRYRLLRRNHLARQRLQQVLGRGPVATRCSSEANFIRRKGRSRQRV
jgi:hypothetical protein